MNTTVLALVLAFFAVACDSTETPTCNPAAPIGTWTAQQKTLQLNADGTCAYAGNACTWQVSNGQIVFRLAEGSTDAARPFWIVGNDLVIDETTWSPVCN